MPTGSPRRPGSRGSPAAVVTSPGIEEGEESVISQNPVRWFEIYVQDLERAKAFYEAVLQTTLTRLESPDIEMWAFPMSEGGAGAAGSLVKMSGVASGGNSTLVYFTCADCATEAGRVVGAGGRLQKEKMSIGQYGYIALAFDTEGNMFGLHSLE